ncbi:MAG TPA: METTL5 family protein [Methylomirabilota bacterium]|nr:METTL5 family protein [Methylomirabilota bacterium]
MRKRDLEIALQAIAPHPNPKVHLEQYTTPADIAADILFSACYTYEDIRGKSVLDLGTGTGRLAIGAAILGAEQVVGIDVDAATVQSALSDSKRMQLKVDWVVGDIESVQDPFDTVIMNPPFGTKREHADIRFLRVALKVGKVIYSIHKSTTHSFISRWLKDAGAESEILMTTKMLIPHQYNFHHKRRHVVVVDVLRIVRG